MVNTDTPFFRPLGWEARENGRTCRIIPHRGKRIVKMTIVQVQPGPRRIIDVVKDTDERRAIGRALQIATDWLAQVPVAGAPA